MAMAPVASNAIAASSSHHERLPPISNPPAPVADPRLGFSRARAVTAPGSSGGRDPIMGPEAWGVGDIPERLAASSGGAVWLPRVPVPTDCGLRGVPEIDCVNCCSVHVAVAGSFKTLVAGAGTCACAPTGSFVDSA